MTTSGRRLAENTLLNLVGQVIPLLIGVAAMPVIVRELGNERFGLLGLAWVVLGLLDVGVSRAASRFMADAIGRNDLAAVPAFAWSAVVMQAIAGVLAGILVFAFAPLLIVMLHVPPSLKPDALTTFRVLAVVMPIFLMGAPFRAILEASRRFDLLNAVNVPSSALSFLIPLLGVLAGLSFTGIIWLLVAGRVATLLAYFALSARLFPDLTGQRRPTKPAARALLVFGGWTMVSNLVSPILDRLDRFLLGAFAGVGSVGYYTAPQEIVQRLRVVPSALAQTLFPEFSALSTPGQADRGRVYYAMGIRFLALVLSPVTLVLALAGPDILRAWLGPDFARQSGTALQFLAAGIFANALASVPYSFLHGINRPDLPAKFHLLELPIFLGLAVVLMPRFGVAGAGAVWALRTGLDLLLLMRAAASHGAVSGPRPVRSGAVAWTLIYCAGVAVGFIPAFGRLPASARLGIAIIACVLIAVTGWFGLLPPEDRARVRRATASLATSVVR